MRYCPHCGSPLVELPLAGRVRLVCPDAQCGWVHWNNPLPVVAGIVEHEDSTGKILLARNAAWSFEFFALITGFLERDESPEAAMAREIKEETSLDTTSMQLVGVYDFQRKNELLIVYHVKARGEIVLSEELSDYRLVEPKDIVPWDQGTGPAVRDWLLRQGIGAID